MTAQVVLTLPEPSPEPTSLAYLGYCLGCGEEAYGVEPDARRYECEACGERKVYGFQELIIMGRIVLE